MSDTFSANLKVLKVPVVAPVDERAEAGESWVGVGRELGVVLLALGQADGTVVAAGLSKAHCALIVQLIAECALSIASETRQ